jgi:heptosyltransferase-1
MERLLILRLGSMGDVVHALPAVHLLRRALPHVSLGWAIEERWSELVVARSTAPTSTPLVDALHYINARAWRYALLSDETWREIIGEMLDLRAVRYDAVVDFQGLWKSAALAAWSGAPLRYGFDRPRERPAGLFYNRRVIAETPHVVEQNMELALALAPYAPRQVCFPLPRDPQAEAWCSDELRRRNISRFVVISPGAGWGAKLWPAKNFARVAQDLALSGFHAVVNYGPGEDALARSVEEMSGGAAQALLCSLGELITLLRCASLFIGGDSGPTHLAAALGTPVVALFGPTDPERNGPYGMRNIVLRSPESLTSYSHRARRDPGLVSITTTEVVAAARRLLEIA